ncbi:MAG: putative signal peptide protein, partial [Bacteroidota bacterium]
MKNFIVHQAKIWLLFLFFGLLAQSGWGQVNISSGTTISENFNAIGATANAALPTGWKIAAVSTARTSSTYAAAVTATANTGGGGSAIATSGVWNFGAGANNSGTDRAIGGLHASSSNRTINVFTQLTNNG